MNADRRRLKIVELISQYRQITVNKLARELNVTTVTIRSDLKILDEAGLVSKCHGGAKSNYRTSPYSERFDVRKFYNLDLKRPIAKIATDFIARDEQIFIDHSTTAHFMHDYLGPQNNLHVITNSLETGTALSKYDSVNLHIAGGNYCRNISGMLGPSCTREISSYRFDKAFIGAAYITPTHLGFENEQEAALKQTIMACSEHVIALVDSSKITEKPMNANDKPQVLLNKAVTVITNDNANSVILKRMENNSCQVLTAAL